MGQKQRLIVESESQKKAKEILMAINDLNCLSDKQKICDEFAEILGQVVTQRKHLSSDYTMTYNNDVDGDSNKKGLEQVTLFEYFFRNLKYAGYFEQGINNNEAEPAIQFWWLFKSVSQKDCETFCNYYINELKKQPSDRLKYNMREATNCKSDSILWRIDRENSRKLAQQNKQEPVNNISVATNSDYILFDKPDASEIAIAERSEDSRSGIFAFLANLFSTVWDTITSWISGGNSIQTAEVSNNVPQKNENLVNAENSHPEEDIAEQMENEPCCGWFDWLFSAKKRSNELPSYKVAQSKSKDARS